MELNEFLKYMESGAEIEAGSEAHLCMAKGLGCVSYGKGSMDGRIICKGNFG